LPVSRAEIIVKNPDDVFSTHQTRHCLKNLIFLPKINEASKAPRNFSLKDADILEHKNLYSVDPTWGVGFRQVCPGPLVIPIFNYQVLSEFFQDAEDLAILGLSEL
jgi:hypothetical protein